MKTKILQVPLMGRLGNQLFIYAAARAMALRNGYKMHYSDYDYTLWHNDSRLNCFKLPADVEYKKSLVFTKKQSIGNFIYKLLCRHKDANQVEAMEKRMQWLFRKFDLFMCQEGFICPGKLTANNIFVFGYFQCDKFFSDYSNAIKKDLEFKIEMFSDDARKFGAKISQNMKSVCLHIRRGDYLNDPVFNVCKEDYYYRAIEKMKILLPDAHYYVFSDNIEEVQGLFAKYEDMKFTYVDSRFTDQESMYLGSCCNNFIMSNSSYSWWMQYLSKNTSKIVLAPNRWFGIKRPCNIYQSNWQLIEV